MTEQKRPEWIEKAAQAVTEFYYHQQDAVQHVNELVQTDIAKTRADVRHVQGSIRENQARNRDTEDKIAEIIHQRFQEA